MGHMKHDERGEVNIFSKLQLLRFGSEVVINIFNSPVVAGTVLNTPI